MGRKVEILQIIPADGWYARFDFEDGSSDKAPLACWTLYRDEDGVTAIGGVDAQELADGGYNLTIYGHFTCFTRNAGEGY